MPDVEKVIKGLECCVAYDYKCNDCPYQDDGGAEDGCYSDELKADAIALLKAQEPVVMAGAELTDAELIEEIRKAPLVLKQNVDAVPVVHGRWIKRKTWNNAVCSYCSFENANMTKYCPACGAKMDGERRGAE